MTSSQTPAALGYRWPAEWEPHSATWLAWPHNQATWPDKFEPIPAQFAALIKTIAQFEPVHLLAGGRQVFSQAKSLVGDLPNVTLFDIATDDAWTRDHGPMFLVDRDQQEVALVDWQYNAWGDKYPPYENDNAVPSRIAEQCHVRQFSPGMVLECGAVEGNGEQTLLTTESCLLNPNRNPTLSRQEVEQTLHNYCCTKKVLWLNGGEIAGDDTDGHIDQIARFVNADTVIAAVEEDPASENYHPLQVNLQQLRGMTTANDQPLNVIPMPMPRPIHFNGQRLPASYCNFYILNRAVLVPQFDDPADKIACQTLAPLFPNREIIGLSAIDIILGLGAFHCLTQQQPSTQ